MKYLLLTTALFSFSAAAEVISFKCDFTDVTHVHQFSLEAKAIEEVDGKFHHQEFDFNLRYAGHVSQFERSVVTRDGSVRFIAPGILGKQRSIQLSSPVKNAELENINLLIDTARSHTSHIRFLDGRTFKGTCKTL
jgi:hypothetical protein